MDKNTLIGFVLIGLVLIGFSWWTKPSQEEIKAQQEQVKKEEVAKKNFEKKHSNLKVPSQDSPNENDSTTLFYHAMQGKNRTVTLENEKLILQFSTKGATVEKAIIKNYKSINGSNDITLFEGKDQKLNYTFVGKENNINTSDLYFEPSLISDSTVTFTAKSEDGRAIQLKYYLGKDYLLHLSMRVIGLDGLFNPNTASIDIDWQDKCKQQEKGFTFENRFSSLTYHNANGGTDYLNETKSQIDEKIENKIDWIAFKNQFFSAVMISKNSFQENSLLTSVQEKKGTGFLKYYQAKAKTFFDPKGIIPSEFEFYYGPNDFQILQKVEKESTFNKNLQLQRLVYLGWPLFRIINRWFTIYVFDWLTAMNINMGIVLILMTLLLKFITYPLVKKTYLNSAKMRVIKPKIEAATAQYSKPEEKMQRQQAMMAEQAKYGVSPLSGCLPMLIQAPIWIAMFNFVPNAIQLRGESFLWIHDLSTYDPIVEWSHHIWLLGDHLSLTCILFCSANLLYSWMTMRQQKDQMMGEQAEQMKIFQWTMFLMPLMFFFMFNDYSAGLNFYYFVSLFMSATIMWMLRKTTDDKKLLAIMEAKYEENKNRPQKLSGLYGRLQAMQEQQMEMQKKCEELQRRKRK